MTKKFVPIAEESIFRKLEDLPTQGVFSGIYRPADEINPKDAAGLQKAPYRVIPTTFLTNILGGFLDGARKYGIWNWRKMPITYSLYLEAIQRHLLALQNCEDVDPGSKVHHLAHIAATCGILLDAEVYGTLKDDRVRPVRGTDWPELPESK